MNLRIRCLWVIQGSNKFQEKMQQIEHRNSASADAKETLVQEMLQKRTKLEAESADLRIKYHQLLNNESENHDQMQNTLDIDLDRVRHMVFG